MKNYFKENITAGSEKKSLENNSSLDKNMSVQTKEFAIDIEFVSHLQSFTRSEEATIFMTMLGTLHVLFSRYNGEDELCMGIPFACQPQTEGEKPVVLFDGLQQVKNKPNAENSFTELLKEIKTTILEASSHDNYLYQNEKEAITKKKDLSLTASSQLMLVVESLKEDCQLQFGILQLSGKPLTLNLPKPGIHFYIKETVNGLNGKIEYNTELYSEERIKRLVDHFKELLVSITKYPHEKISKLNILSPAEKHQLLVEFNDTAMVYPRDKTIVNLFEEQVNKNSAKVALVFENDKLTYGELNKRSNQLACYLVKRGVKKEALIPICIERSFDMIIGILGILKAGAAYVPIDPEYPEDRINYMLEDTAASVVISSKKSRLKLSSSKEIDIIELDGHWDAINNMPLQNPDFNINSSNLAYVIYTSGSTGKPKGVMIEHQAVIDHCYGLIKAAQLNTCSSFALFSPLVFDAGHSIIFTSIFTGASLNVLSKELIMDGEKLVTYLEANPVDCIKIVPSVWLSYINGENTVLADKIMIFGGETFSGKIKEHLIKLNYRGSVYNHYGPTEATIGKCIHKVDLKKDYKTVPIGKPFSNTQLYVVDHLDQLVPIGIAGELYIAGEGIARKYLNRPELTAEKFIPDPFRINQQSNIYDPSNRKSLLRLYKTGDKVRWNNDGEIEYLGRIDEQVKINGYRIELGEIENVLLQNKKIKQAAIRLTEDSYGKKMLVGYIVPNEPFNKEETIAKLKEKLPEYMIPGLWVELDHLPLTSNGKIDKKALPLPDISKLLKGQFAAPANDIETALVKIWKNLLGVKEVGIYDSFFELGGNSIQAVSMFSRVRKHFGKDLPLAIIFQAPNISKLAEIIGQKESIVNLTCLVAIQPQGSNPPLFCMHAGAGNVLFYKDLANNLGVKQPLYGLMARGLNGKEHFHTSIEEMATHYIKEIKSLQPHGPYFLAGYCLGGTIAFEMAKQLLKEGDKVELLATFNTRSPTYLNASSGNISGKAAKSKPSLFSNISAYAGNFSSLNSKGKLLYPLKVMKIGSNLTANILYKKTQKSFLKINAKVTKIGFDYYLSRGRLLPKLLRNKYMLHTNGYMSRAYEPGIYPGRMYIFRSPQIYYKDPFLGWKEHAAGGIEYYDVPGKYKHRSEIMNDPFVKVISAKLKTLLESSSKKSSFEVKSKAEAIS